MRKSSKRQLAVLAAACGAALAVIAPEARAVDRTWSGGGDNNNWGTNANWVGNVAPAPNDALIFDGFARLTPTNDYAPGTAFDGITFAPTAGPFNLTGNQVTLHGDIVDNTTVLLQTIGLPLALDGTRTINVIQDGSLAINGVISGPAGMGLVKTGSGLLTLGGANTFSGPVTIRGGVVSVSTPANLGGAPPAPTPGALVIDGGTLLTTANLALNPNRGIALGPTTGAGAGTFDVTTGTTLSYGGVIANNGPAGTGGLNKLKFGTLMLSGANTYTGPTRVMNGTLALDFSQAGAPTNDIVSSASALSLGGANAGLGNVSHATLTVTGRDNTSNSQTFNGTTIDIGPAVIRASSGAAGTTTVNLGALTHNTGGVVNFVRPASGGIKTTTPNVNGILGGWATIGTGAAPVGNITIGTEWASVDAGGNIVPFAGHYDYVTGTELRDVAPAGANVRLNGSSTGDMLIDGVGAGTTTDINTLQFENAAPRSIIIGTGNTLRLGQSGGIFRSDATTGGVTWAIGTSTGGGNGVPNDGTLTAGGADNTPGEIVFTMNSPSQTAGSLNVEVRIADNGTGPVSVVKLGAGSMKLRGNNTYSGGTYILQGRLQLAGSEIGSANPDGFGTGPVYIVPGAQMFPSGAGTAAPIMNPLFIAGLGTSAEPIGVIRMGNGINIGGPVTLTGDARIGGGNGGQTQISGKISGAFNLDFGTPGTIATNLMITNPENDWTGQTTLVGRNGGNAGHTVTLRLGNNEVIPDGFGKGNVTVLGGQDARTTTLEMNGFSETINGLLSGGTLTNAIVQNSAAGTVSTLTVGNYDQTATFGGVLRDAPPTGGGQLALRKIGAGIQTLSGENSYTGPTTVDGGTLSVLSSIPNSIVTVNAGGTLSGTGDGVSTGVVNNVVLSAANGPALARIAPGSTGATGTVGTLTVGSLTSNGGDMKVDLVGTSSDLINVTGAATFAAGSASTVSPNAGAKAGTYTFLTAPTLSIDPAATITVNDPSDPTARPATYTLITEPNALKLQVVGGAKNITWTGAVDGRWDINGTANWRDDVTPAIVEKFFNGDTVTFGAGAANRNVTLNELVLPGDVNVNNPSGQDYTIAGTGGIAGGGKLTKQGAGTLTLLTNNTYSGPTDIQAGRVVVGDGGTTGSLGTGAMTNNGTVVFNRSDDVTFAAPISGSGGIEKLGAGVLTLSGANTYTGANLVTAGTLRAGGDGSLGTGATIRVMPGATLDVNGSNLTTNPLTVGGAGVGGLGAVINSGADELTALSSVTLTGDTVFGGTGRFDIVNGQLSTGGQAYKLTKVGTGILTLDAVTVDPTLGDIDVQAGRLGVETTTTGLGNPAATLRLASGSTLELFDLTTNLNKVIVSDGATIRAASGTLNHLDGPVTLSATTTLEATADDVLNVNGAVRGAGGVTKIGAGTVNLNQAVNTFAGPTTINGGRLVVKSLANGGQPSGIGQSGAGAANLVIGGGGILEYAGSTPATTDRAITLGGSAGLAASGTVPGASLRFTNPAPLVLTGNGNMTVTLTGNNTDENLLAGAIGDRPGGATSLQKEGLSLWVLEGNNTYSGPTTLVEGTLRVRGSIANSSAVTIPTGATFEADSTQTVKNLSADVFGGVTVRPGGFKTLKIENPIISPNAFVDVHDNALALDYTPEMGSPLQTVRQMVLLAWNGGAWDGTQGGITSTAAKNNPSSTAVGFGEAGEILGAGGGTFGGVPVDDTTVLVRYVLKGDATLDGSVNFDDLAKLAQNYNNMDGQRMWNHGDFTYDGNVNFDDLAALAQNYNTSLPAAAQIAALGGGASFGEDVARAFAQVPEPGALAVVALAGALMGGRRRRR